MKRGSVVAMGAETHVSENVGTTPTKAVLIEFKKPAPPAATAKRVPTQRECKLVAESPHATAQLCSGAAGSTVAEHTHTGDVVYVALTDVSTEITAADGTKRSLEMKRGAAAIAAPETHSAKNIGQDPFELIVVDLK
jgi:quercetin dioxygenase-like cupin family protein